MSTSEIKLNKELLIRQGVSEEKEQLILQLHEQLDRVCNSPEDFDNPAEFIEKIEFELQQLWGFSQDRNRHTHWLRIKGCTCPRLDNQDRIGTPYRVISGDCPWHNN